jgi:hypothetical protein
MVPLPALFGWVLAAMFQTQPQGASTSICDPQLAQVNADPLGYRQRGDRCEGVYIEEVAGHLAVVVASFTESFADFDGQSGKNLTVEWDPFGRAPVRLRAASLSYRLHYRMDTVRPANTATFEWPTNVMRALGVSRESVGLVGRTTITIGDAPSRDLYLPLRVSQGGRPGRSGTLRLVLLPGEELKDVTLGLSFLGADGRSDISIHTDKSLAFSYYPAERPIAATLPSPVSAGLYRLTVGAVLARGGSSTQTIWFYLSR